MDFVKLVVKLLVIAAVELAKEADPRWTGTDAPPPEEEE